MTHCAAPLTPAHTTALMTTLMLTTAHTTALTTALTEGEGRGPGSRGHGLGERPRQGTCLGGASSSSAPLLRFTRTGQVSRSSQITEARFPLFQVRRELARPNPVDLGGLTGFHAQILKCVRSYAQVSALRGFHSLLRGKGKAMAARPGAQGSREQGGARAWPGKREDGSLGHLPAPGSAETQKPKSRRGRDGREPGGRAPRGHRRAA